jgi:hypothetical protein
LTGAAVPVRAMALVPTSAAVGVVPLASCSMIGELYGPGTGVRRNSPAIRAGVSAYDIVDYSSNRT